MTGVGRTGAALLLCLFGGLSAAEVDYADYRGVLSHVNRRGEVDYRTLQAGAARKRLGRFLKTAGQVRLGSLGRKHRLALLINLYNAYTLELILRHYPVSSIKKIPRAWKRRDFLVDGKLTSLDRIEHGLIRGQYDDARVHFVLNCSAVSCPRLRATVFTAQNVYALLERATAEFVNNSRFNRYRITRTEGGGDELVMTVSRLFRWYRTDFVKQYGSLKSFFLRYLDKTYRAVLNDGRHRISYMTYDWTLNNRRRDGR